jgi:hypothetical protein
MVILLVAGASVASASEVTGTLSSSGVSSQQTGGGSTNGSDGSAVTGTIGGSSANTLSGTVSGGSSGGGAAGIGGNTSVSGGTLATNLPGLVLGAETGPMVSSSVAGRAPVAPQGVTGGNAATVLASTQGPTSQGAGQLAAVAASGTGISLGWFWLALLLLLVAAVYAGWRYYQDHRTTTHY